MGQDGFNWFVGVVEDRADPEKVGRVRVRCMGYHTADIQEIPTEDLPWASVMMPVTAGANSGIGFSPHFLIEGTWVVGFFRDPAKQEPVIIGAIPGKNTTETTNFTIAASSKVGGYSGSSTTSAPPAAATSAGGFIDPNTKYPSELYLDKPDTNLLAQGTKEVVDDGFIIVEDEWNYQPIKLYQPPKMDLSKAVEVKKERNFTMETCSKKYFDVMKEIV